MTNESGPHLPTKDFRAALEGKVIEALVQERRYTAADRNSRRRRFMFMGSLAATLAIGFVLGAAPAQIQDAKQRDSLLAAEQTAEGIALARVNIAFESYRIAKIRFELDLVTDGSVLAAESELREMERILAGTRLNLDEIRLSSTAPRNDLSAPLVGQRDFVTERIKLAMESAQRQLIAAEANVNQAEMRHQSGAPESEMARAKAAHEGAKAQMAFLVAKLELRKSFFADRLAPGDVERREQLLQLRRDLLAAQDLYNAALVRLKEYRVRQAVAAKLPPDDPRARAAQADDLRIQLDILERAADVDRITQRLKLLESSGRGTAR